jgi:hypothetical protein
MDKRNMQGWSNKAGNEERKRAHKEHEHENMTNGRHQADGVIIACCVPTVIDMKFDESPKYDKKNLIDRFRMFYSIRNCQRREYELQ